MPDFSTGHADESLTTDATNQEASRVWEGQLRLAIKDGPLRFLFDNKGSQYHGSGFEMLATLMQHCRPDTVTNAFSSLLSLFNNVQGDLESIIKYWSWFDGLTIELARCKVIIPSLLLVMLFLRALHGRYSSIMEQFCTRFKPIETATIDSIVSNVIYNDGFQVVDHSKNGTSGSVPPHVPAAAAANTNSDQNGKVWQNPFEWLAKYGKKGIKSRWSRALTGKGICPICHRDELPCHVLAQCPLLAELHLKLILCPPVAAPSAPGPAPSPALAPTPGGRAAAAGASSTLTPLASSIPPSGLMVAVAPSPAPAGDYESDEEFHWDGDNLGVDYAAPPTVNKHVLLYSPSCSHISVAPTLPVSPPSSLSLERPSCLSSGLRHLLHTLSKLPVVLPLRHGWLAVADTGATDHLVPDKSCFISYKAIPGLSVRMGNNSFAPVLGCGPAIFALNVKRVLIRHVLHVPGLAVPLYSLCTHVTQRGCGFFGTKESGFLVYFPTFVLSVDTAVDCRLSFDPLGQSAPLPTLDYVQPHSPAAVYPSEVSPALSNATPSPVSPALVEDDDNNDVPLPTLPSWLAPDSSKMPSPDVDLSVLSNHLKRLMDAVNRLTLAPTPVISSSPSPLDIDAEEPSSPPNGEPTDLPTSRLLSTMTSKKITILLHHPGTTFPSVRPCDTANSSDTKTHWSAEELHHIMGCRKFCNYKHLLQVSRDSKWVDGGEFPSSLGSYATIPKAKRGGTLDRMMYLYLDAVHMDIAFGDCVAVSCYRYALILVDCATRYNWTFGLKTLSSANIILALCLFRATAGCLAHTIYSDCDLKLFGYAVSKYLIDGQSKVIAAPAKHQLANGLVESHWKTMVHMAHAYITEKQMPRTF
jgi:hypothetical protein